MLKTDKMAVFIKNGSSTQERAVIHKNIDVSYFLANTVINVMIVIAVLIMPRPNEKVGATLQMPRFLYLLGST
jgi:hypothetical protein